MFLGQTKKTWRQRVSATLILVSGAIALPLSVYWMLPFIFWLVARLLSQTLQGFWLVLFAVYITGQATILWNMPFGAVLVMMALLFWSWQVLLARQKNEVRWLLEILHGAAVVTVLFFVYGGAAGIFFFLNIFAVLASVLVGVVLEQRAR